MKPGKRFIGSLRGISFALYKINPAPDETELSRPLFLGLQLCYPEQKGKSRVIMFRDRRCVCEAYDLEREGEKFQWNVPLGFRRRFF
ncbi:hypothetical protein CEXT_80541 [Caerostris extrusa]|uniref:Uncharacterized protein n=1 Tax=Caerostris extrusa TaxID=172846 RepID=A0AAV4TL77_CAEEX|nr:hypothetical protein CEXT_80541 [Caerostris extrusa]